MTEYERDDEAFGEYTRRALAQGFYPARDFVTVSALAADDPFLPAEALLSGLGMQLSESVTDTSVPGWVIYWRRESFERFA